jgi:hypothetical protein
MDPKWRGFEKLIARIKLSLHRDLTSGETKVRLTGDA